MAVLAAPLVIPFAEALGLSVAILGMDKASDKVNQFIKDNPEESMKIFQMIMPAQGIANALKNKSSEEVEEKISLEDLEGMSDEEAIIYLSKLRQIGRWSAEMILLFTYNRPNIWPVQDIGLLRAISKNYNKKYLPPESYVNLLQKRFSPYCSVATWYLWRSIDPEPIQY